jgi:hypothetical protein
MKKGREFWRVNIRSWTPAWILGLGDKPASSTRRFRYVTPDTHYLGSENSCGYNARGSRDKAITEVGPIPLPGPAVKSGGVRRPTLKPPVGTQELSGGRFHLDLTSNGTRSRIRNEG